MTVNDGEVNQLAEKLLKELYDSKDLDFDKKSLLLTEFRILTREKTLNSTVLNKDCIDCLISCSIECHIEAQKCLSNLILNYIHMREDIIDPYVRCFDGRLKSIINNQHNPMNDASGSEQFRELLLYDLRIIFLLSALCPASRARIRDQLLEQIIQVTVRLADDFSQHNLMVIVESLKTLFNLTMDKCINENLVEEVFGKLFRLVNMKDDLPTEPKLDDNLTKDLLVNLIHLLTNMPKKVYSNLALDDVDKILDHLDNQLKTCSREDFRDYVLPVLNVCANICKYNGEARKRWFDIILGSATDFERRPEEYDTLRGRLVKQMTSVDDHIKDITAEFIYSLCDSDTEKFITYTGFGNSAAFLSSRGLLGANKVPIRTDRSSCGTTRYEELRQKIDPITGKLDTPKEDCMAGATEEEKEVHAHELADAITKLAGLGIITPAKIDQDGRITGFHPDSNKEPES